MARSDPGTGGPGQGSARTGRPGPGGGGADGRRERAGRWAARGAATLVSAAVLLAGLWLVLAPFVLGYDTGVPEVATWNDVIVGGLVAVVALTRMVTPARTAPLSLVTVGLGVWLILAPFVLGYDTGSGATAATWNDVVVGVVLGCLGLLALGFGLSGRGDSAPSSARRPGTAP